ncbi:P-loop containing nucleoside triphosphate hydrolase protein [Panus rudis PR-1116 ss-1]|nr:P-loop containing nucleoside triphosphate hydrolase protein [Panus rudis PR-1116 ss-1]
METFEIDDLSTFAQLLGGRGRGINIGHGLDSAAIAMPAPARELVNYDPKAQAQDAVEEEVAIGDAGSVLEVKHIDEIYDMLTGRWTVKPTPPDAVSAPSKEGGKYDAYAFTVVRKFQPTSVNHDRKATAYNVTKLVEIHSEHLKNVGHAVIGNVQGISWNSKPLRINPQVFLGWLPELQAHSKELSEHAEANTEGSTTNLELAHLQHLLNYLTTTYAATLTTLDSLVSHGQITFDTLWALFVPKKTILYLLCPVTSEPRAVRLIHAERCQKQDTPAGAVSAAYDPSGLTVGADGGNEYSKFLWRLVVEYVEVDVGTRKEPGVGTVGYGYAGLGSVLDIAGFPGARAITSLGVYPIEHYTGPGGPEGLKKRLIERGRRWATMAGGTHHLSYQGIAYQYKKHPPGYVKCNVNSRVMIDRKTFAETVPDYGKFPLVTKTLSGDEIDRHVLRLNTGTTQQAEIVEAKDLADEHLLLTTPIVYGFSLSDKLWVEFTADFVQPFEWGREAYENLVIPAEQKILLTTLVEAHNTGPGAKFSDFVEGKGLGLVINLFGNPGTGKSLTAEAMSEYLKKPLYVVGAGDLGTSAERVDAMLSVILRVSATWNAVVLIDEADVFLEERSLQYLERNAMVAVFLRHLEYFRGILFLTTNRVRVFDEAFQSRIHVSLRYHDLKPDARRKIWLAFLRKANGDIPNGGLTSEQLRDLGEKKINGRQIKNVVRTAGALAFGKQETLAYEHLSRVLDMMDQFDASHTMYQ